MFQKELIHPPGGAHLRSQKPSSMVQEEPVHAPGAPHLWLRRTPPPPPHLIVVLPGGFPLQGAQRLQLSIQDVQQLLQQPHSGADIARINRASRVPGQLDGDVGCVLPALNLQLIN